MLQADGVLAEGVVDLAFREGEEWWVVDFKTDRQLEGALDVYRRQVQLYAEMVSAATSEPARAVLLRL
jgi:ATP-dependent exoDNAse (exonuclease V) beta subunit